jgi:chemotaxis protein histidine kinase CheA
VRRVAPVVCEARFDALMSALGASRLQTLAGDLDGRLAGLLGAVAEDAGPRDALIRRTHRDRGAAGTLGFLALAEALERLERVLAGDGGTETAVAEVRQAHVLASDALAKALDAAMLDQAAGRPSL